LKSYNGFHQSGDQEVDGLPEARWRKVKVISLISSRGYFTYFFSGRALRVCSRLPIESWTWRISSPALDLHLQSLPPWLTHRGIVIWALSWDLQPISVKIRKVSSRNVFKDYNEFGPSQRSHLISYTVCTRFSSGEAQGNYKTILET